MEYVFLLIYTVELSLRIFVVGTRCLHDHWVKFDFLLVCIGYVGIFIQEAMKGMDELEVLMVLRTVRMLRLARTVRLLVKFRVLWMLVRGLLSSAGTMVYTLILLLVLIY